ncbi:MAG TPA: SDR family oxidoreductase [Planctomycetota bacterium]|nr:SDR family oxidoreductase [Planctomycetota bacterium]
MLLQHKTAVIYGGGGTLGGAVARAFAREGATVHLAGRTQAKLDHVAMDVAAAGGLAHTAVVDALDEDAVGRHVDAVAAGAGQIDIALNAIGVVHVQGTPLAELSLADFMRPIDVYLRSNFITARAVARHMVRRRTGVILMLSTPASRMAGTGFLGFGAACGAVEALTRLLAAEVGGAGVRVACLRPEAVPQALATSHSREIFSRVAERAGTTAEALLDERARTTTLLGRFPTLDEVGDCAAFLASDRAGAMTGAIANLTCGALVD